jgi:hypothetical protein
MELLLILVGFTLMVMVLAAPKSASYMMWFALLCYPHQVNEMVSIPLGVGGDDFLVSMLFVSVAIRCIFKGKLNFATATRAALLFSMVEMVSEFTGALTTPGLMAGAYKVTLKGLVYIMFAFILDNTLDSDRDIKYSMYFMMTAAGFGAITAIGQKYAGGVFQIFTPVVATSQTSIRGGGAFITPGGAGITMLLMLVLCVCLLQAKGGFLNRGFVVVVTAMYVGGLGATVAGSSAAGTAAALGGMALLGRRRGILLAVLGIGVLIVISLAPFLFEEVAQKLTGPKLVAKLGNRAEIWWNVISRPSPYQLLCGQGVAAELGRLGDTPHNGYLYHSFTMGLGGAIWAVWFYWQMLFRGRKLSLRPWPGAEAIGRWNMWALLGVAVTNITSNVWEVSFSRYLLYAAVAYTAAFLEMTSMADESIPVEEEELAAYGDGLPEGLWSEGAYSTAGSISAGRPLR